MPGPELLPESRRKRTELNMSLTCPEGQTESFYFICFYSDSVCSNWVKVHLETKRTKGLLLVLDVFLLQISPKGFRGEKKKKKALQQNAGNHKFMGM